MTTPTTEDIQDLVSKAMRRAWQLGQTYWQQVDSEYTSHHKKADVTQAAFNTLVDETRAALSRPPGGWLEAAVAWEVCASVHQKWAKGKDAFYTTRQSDFVNHANTSRVNAYTEGKTASTADNLREPKDGAEWKVVWWNESARLMLPANKVLSSAKSYGNNTLMFTIKKRVYETQPTPKDPS